MQGICCAGSCSALLPLRIQPTASKIFLVPLPDCFNGFPLQNKRNPDRNRKKFNHSGSCKPTRSSSTVICGILPVDPWSPTIDSQSIASQLFAASLFPYLCFLYFITKSKSAPKLTLFGFYFLLAFVGATIPAGIYAKVHYGKSLSNVDWLHGCAESLLTLTNLFIIMGLREALRKAKYTKEDTSEVVSDNRDE